MKNPVIFESETNFCMIMWEFEPVTGGALFKLCEKKLGWKKSTVYTVIKRLAQRGIIKFENGVVSAIVSKNQYAAFLLDDICARFFDGDAQAMSESVKKPAVKTSKKRPVTTAKSLPDEYAKPSKTARKAPDKAKADVNKTKEPVAISTEIRPADRKIPSFLL